jgi:ribosomal protein S18 acetylase RimI-like enzyme
VPRLWVATPDEVGVVAELLAAFRDWWGYSVPDDESMRASVTRLIEDPATDFLLGAVDSGSDPVGVVQLRYRHSVWTGSDDAWLEDVYVRDSARGTGLGRALTEFAFEQASRRGCRRIQLDVNIGNKPAKALYESLGFSAWSESLGADTLFMTRVLQDVRGPAHS